MSRDITFLGRSFSLFHTYVIRFHTIYTRNFALKYQNDYKVTVGSAEESVNDKYRRDNVCIVQSYIFR